MRKAWEEGEEPVRDQATTRVRGNPSAIDIGKGVCFRVQSCNKHYKLPNPPCITLTLSDFCTDGSKGQRCRAAVEADSAQLRVKIDPWTQPYVVGVRRTTWMSKLIAYVQTHNGKWHENMIFPFVMRRDADLNHLSPMGKKRVADTVAHPRSGSELRSGGTLWGVAIGGGICPCRQGVY